MKRRTITITLLLFLSGGAIVNITVAWGSIRFAHKLSQPTYENVDITQPLSPHDTAWLQYAAWRQVPMPADRELQPALWAKQSAFGVENRVFYIFYKQSIETGRGEHMLGGPMDLYSIRSGWPMYALEGGIRRSGPRSFRWAQSSLQNFDAVSLIKFETSPMALAIGFPLRPIFPGFLINTLFYALLLWLFFVAMFATRRRSPPASEAEPKQDAPECVPTETRRWVIERSNIFAREMHSTGEVIRRKARWFYPVWVIVRWPVVILAWAGLVLAHIGIPMTAVMIVAIITGGSSGIVFWSLTAVILGLLFAFLLLTITAAYYKLRRSIVDVELMASVLLLALSVAGAILAIPVLEYRDAKETPPVLRAKEVESSNKP